MSGTATVDQKLEVVTIPVSDVDRATEFYRRLGWRQGVTPPGSCVVHFTPPGLWVLGPIRHEPHIGRGLDRSEEA
jgi:catechol 2,3-dioxygenase-like lactoylglutathione lyase family enzyme